MLEFLLELFSEEMPARFQKQAAEDLVKLFTEGLTEQGLSFQSIKSFVTPRRMGLVIDGLPMESFAQQEERKGPKVGAPEVAINGFLKGAGLASLDECKQVETPKGNFWVASIEIPARKTEEILADILRDALLGFPWKKSQNWGEGTFKWVRPLRSIIALFDEKILPYYLYLGNGDSGIPASLRHINEEISDEEKGAIVKISNVTQGHRFLSAGIITVQNYTDYAAKLRDAKVLIDREERKKKINEISHSILSEKKLSLKEDIALLEEVSGLVEWPVQLIGYIDQEFMEIPPEVLITTMRNNQKYFSVVNNNGVMQPEFVITSNLETEDKGQAIIAGNERVLRARFSDAKFFWDLDKQRTLESRLPLLSSVVFHARLGSMTEKMHRLESLSAEIASILSTKQEAYGLQTEMQRAARLAKADLVTDMVGEFPELQGIMGAYYARHDGEADSVVNAIKGHYSPLGPNDQCPSAPVSVVVALADKIDILVGFFAIDEKPTGSKDPYALRRAALGILRIIIENNLRFNFQDILRCGYAAYKRHSNNASEHFAPEDKLINDLCLFFSDRLKAMLRDKGIRHDVVESILANGISDITQQMLKLDALNQALQTEDGNAVVALYNRASNILRIEEKKDAKSYSTIPLNEDLLVEPEERNLQKSISKILPQIKTAIFAERYQEAMDSLLGLRADINSFFDKTTINADDPSIRVNRLILLSQVRDVIHEISDFSLLENKSSAS